MQKITNLIVRRIKSKAIKEDNHSKEFIRKEIEHDIFVITNLLLKRVREPDPVIGLIHESSKKFLTDLFEIKDYDDEKELHKEKLQNHAAKYCSEHKSDDESLKKCVKRIMEKWIDANISIHDLEGKNRFIDSMKKTIKDFGRKMLDRKTEQDKQERISDQKIAQSYEEYFNKRESKPFKDTMIVKQGSKLVESVRHSVGAFLRSIVKPQIEGNKKVSNSKYRTKFRTLRILLSQ